MSGRNHYTTARFELQRLFHETTVPPHLDEIFIEQSTMDLQGELHERTRWTGRDEIIRRNPIVYWTMSGVKLIWTDFYFNGRSEQPINQLSSSERGQLLGMLNSWRNNHDGKDAFGNPVAEQVFVRRPSKETVWLSQLWTMVLRFLRIK